MLIVKSKFAALPIYDDAMAGGRNGRGHARFNFYPKSPRYIQPEEAVKIIRQASRFVDIVGVLSMPTFKQINADHRRLSSTGYSSTATKTRSSAEQFRNAQRQDHKSHPRQNRKRTSNSRKLFAPTRFCSTPSTRKNTAARGLTFDWNIVGHIATRVFLAGGINPENVVKAIELGVYGIDVCSGIESERRAKKTTKK